MPSLWQLLFHIASCESADRNWSSEAMAQIQPNPKWLDAPESIRPRGVLPHSADDSRTSAAVTFGCGFVKAKLPYIFGETVALPG